jgi:hypothetical protein
MISRAEDTNYGTLSFKTVIAIANGFDVAFVGRFVPFSQTGERNGAEQRGQP